MAGDTGEVSSAEARLQDLLAGERSGLLEEIRAIETTLA